MSDAIASWRGRPRLSEATSRLTFKRWLGRDRRVRLLEFLVLGSVVVRSQAGEDRPLRPKSQELLALLLLASNRSLASDVLIDRLWRATPPDTAETALRVHLSALRSSLRSDDTGVSRLGRAGSGYVVSVGLGELDAERFDHAISEGAALATSTPREAEPMLRTGLELWRGVPYDGLDDLEGVAEERERLDRRRLHGLVALGDSMMRMGRYEELAAEAGTWSARYPTSERLAALQVEAIYSAGDQVTSLRVWRSFAEQLRAEFGIEPGAELRALENSILQQSITPRFARSTGDTPPTRRRLGALLASPLIERTGAIESILTAVDGSGERTRYRLVVVEGEAGIGKSAVLREVHRALPESILLGGRSDGTPLELITELARALGDSGRQPEADPTDPHGPLAARIAELLGGHPSITVIVDDLTACDDDSLRVIRRLLGAAVGTWIVGGRPADLSTHPLTQDRTVLADTRLVRLDPLSRAGIEQLAMRLGTGALDPDVLDRLEQSTAGNPFLVTALTRHAPTDGRAIPAQAVAHVDRLVGELGAAGQTWLRCAAVDRSPVIDLEATAGAAGLARGAVLEAAESALALGLITEVEHELRFRHALVREALVGSLSGVRVREVHLGLARVLLERSDRGDPTRLGYHLRESGEPSLQGLAAEVTAQEAEQALVSGAVVLASERFDTAAALGGGAGIDERRLVAWRLRRCVALASTGRLVEAQHLAARCADAARRLDDREQFSAAAVEATGPIMPTGAVRSAAEAFVVEALDWYAHDGEPAPIRLCEAAARIAVTRADHVSIRLREHIQPVLEAASERPRPADSQVLSLLGLRSLSWAARSTPAARAQLSSRAVGAARRSSQLWLRLRAAREHATDLFAAGDEALGDVLRANVEEAHASGSPFHHWLSLVFTAALHEARGDTGGARAARLSAQRLEPMLESTPRDNALVATVLADHIRRHDLRALQGVVGPDSSDRDISPSLELGRLAIAADAGQQVNERDVLLLLAAALHGPPRAAAVAFATLAMAASVGRGTKGPRWTSAAKAIVDEFTPASGGFILLEGGFACLGPVDAYLAACFEALGDHEAERYHLARSDSVSARFAPAWAGWTVWGTNV